MTFSDTLARPKSAFHMLRVAHLEPLTDDAVAVTFDVPAELSDDYAFKPGQSLTLRRMIDGRDHRRTYSICAPAGQRPRIGVREVPDGLFSRWLVRDVVVGDQIEVQTPTGTFAADPDQGSPRHDRRRFRHHADTVDRVLSARQPGFSRHALLRQP